jgi:predicted transcriptional regulator with HTH domain
MSSFSPDASLQPPVRPQPTTLALAAGLLALLWLGLLVFYTRSNGFPFYYHTDEPSKVAQVLAGERNFFHPQLLMLGAELTLRTGAFPRTEQGIALAGRWTSAAYAAAAVVLLALLAGRLGGSAAGAIAALLTGAHPLLYELAHYMKEDCAWLGGLAATLLAAAGLERRRTPGRAALLGAAAGLAASGKYIGVTALVAAAVFVACLPRDPERPGHRRRLLGFLLGGFAGSFALVNWLVLAHPIQAWTGLREELGRMRDLTDDQGLQFQGRYLQKAIKLTWPSPLLPALGFAGWTAWRTWGRGERRAVEWLCIAFALGFLAVLLVTPRIKERYLLPVVEISCVLAALGIARFGASLVPRLGRGAAAGFMALAALGAAGVWVPDLAACWRDFHSDARKELLTFLRERVPADALVAHDWRVALTRGRRAALGPAHRFPQPTVESTRFLADLGTLEDFQRWGVRYFVVTNEDYGNIFNAPDFKKNAALKARCQAFYGGLFSRGELIWQRPRGRLPYLHPDLSVYYLKDGG